VGTNFLNEFPWNNGNTRKQLFETDMTQHSATDIRPAQPWKRAQDHRQFDHADVHAQAPTAVNRDIIDSSNMATSTQPGDALIMVESVKELPPTLEETHLLSYIATSGRWARKRI
jgi:hypothetical protein